MLCCHYRYQFVATRKRKKNAALSSFLRRTIKALLYFFSNRCFPFSFPCNTNAISVLAHNQLHVFSTLLAEASIPRWDKKRREISRPLRQIDDCVRSEPPYYYASSSFFISREQKNTTQTQQNADVDFVLLWKMNGGKSTRVTTRLERERRLRSFAS